MARMTRFASRCEPSCNEQHQQVDETTLSARSFRHYEKACSKLCDKKLRLIITGDRAV